MLRKLNELAVNSSTKIAHRRGTAVLSQHHGQPLAVDVTKRIQSQLMVQNLNNDPEGMSSQKLSD